MNLKHIKVLLLFLASYSILNPASPSCQEANATIRFGTINNPETKLFRQASAVLTAVFEKNGYRFSLKHLPGNRSLKWANQGVLDGDAFRVYDLNKSDSYPNLVRVGEPIITIDQSVWSKSDIKIDGWASFGDYRIVYIRGAKSIEKKTHLFKSALDVGNMRQVFSLLNIGRADLTITSRETGTMFLKKLKMEDSGIRVLSPPLEIIRLYPYLNKTKLGRLAPVLADTLKGMKADGTYYKILERVQDNGRKK